MRQWLEWLKPREYRVWMDGKPVPLGRAWRMWLIKRVAGEMTVLLNGEVHGGTIILGTHDHGSMCERMKVVGSGRGDYCQGWPGFILTVRRWG